MKWKIIFILLSLFCLSIAFIIEELPSHLKIYFSTVSVLMCSYLIAKYAPGKYFLFGLLLGIFINLSVFSRILIVHATPSSLWPVIVIISSGIFGLFSFIASKFTKK